jgi:hypothetical protein
MLDDRDRDLVKVTVRETLEQVGVDTKNPAETRADMAWLRAARKLWIAVLGAVITAATVAAAMSRHLPNIP